MLGFGKLFRGNGWVKYYALTVAAKRGSLIAQKSPMVERNDLADVLGAPLSSSPVRDFNHLRVPLQLVAVPCPLIHQTHVARLWRG